MKKLFLLGACLLALRVTPVMAQATEPEVVVVRVHEDPNEVILHITRAQGATEEVKFKSAGFGKTLGVDSKGYHAVFTRLYREGYTLQSTFSSPWRSPNNSGEGATTLLFVKSPKP